MSGEVKFYLDEHVNPAIAVGLRRRGVDVLTTQEAGMLNASDDKQLALATSEGRVIFTQDEDFLRLNKVVDQHPGIVYARQRTPVGVIVRGLMLIHLVLSAEEMCDRVEYL
jgi:predicted nuclease of predicted toxin-antitoxin system